MLSFMRAAWLPLLIVALLGCWIILERSPGRPGSGVTLRWEVDSQERDRVFVRAIRAAFQARHPGIRIRFIKQNEGRKVETMIVGGDAPDVMELHLDKPRTLALALARFQGAYGTDNPRAHGRRHADGCRRCW